jgi:hypothetical protein
LLAQRPARVQDLRQGLFDTRFPLLRRQVQDPHVLPARTLRLLRHQRVVGAPVRHGWVQVLAVRIARERPGFAYQPVDHVTIVNPVFRLAPQAFHLLHQRTRVPHFDLFGTDARLDRLSHQPRWHRVQVLLHLDRAALAHPHLLPLQRLQPTLRQRAQPRLLPLKSLPAAPIPPGHQRTHELPVLLTTAKVPAATQHQLLR